MKTIKTAKDVSKIASVGQVEKIINPPFDPEYVKKLLSMLETIQNDESAGSTVVETFIISHLESVTGIKMMNGMCTNYPASTIVNTMQKFLNLLE